MRIFSIILFLFSPFCYASMTYTDIPLAIDEKTPNIDNLPPLEKSMWKDIILAKSVTMQSRKEGIILNNEQLRKASISMVQSPKGLVDAVNYYMAGKLGSDEYMYAYPSKKNGAIIVVVNENLEKEQLAERVEVAKFLQNLKKNYTRAICPLIRDVKFPLRVDRFVLDEYRGKNYIYGTFSVDWEYCKSTRKYWEK